MGHWRALEQEPLIRRRPLCDGKLRFPTQPYNWIRWKNSLSEYGRNGPRYYGILAWLVCPLGRTHDSKDPEGVGRSCTDEVLELSSINLYSCNMEQFRLHEWLYSARGTLDLTTRWHPMTMGLCSMSRAIDGSINTIPKMMAPIIRNAHSRTTHIKSVCQSRHTFGSKTSVTGNLDNLKQVSLYPERWKGL